MVYETFERLLKLKFSLLRILHEAAPTQRTSLRAAIARADEQLAHCERYQEYLRQYASLVRRVG